MLASMLVRVADLDRSLDFYRNQLGFALDWHRPEVSAAQVVSPTDRPLLLAGPAAGDLADSLTTPHGQARPGKRMYLGGGTAAYRAQLEQRGVPVAWTEFDWGSTNVLTTDPDGHILSFDDDPAWTDAELLHWYRLGPRRLDEAIQGLTEADLDLVRAPGKWSIRQTVLHLVDSDCTSLARPKYALAETGRAYQGNSYNPDAWAEGLDYAHRPIAAEVALFRAIRAHLAGLLEHLPGALDRVTARPAGAPLPVRPAIYALTIHALLHIDQIRETRAVHGR